MGSGIPIIYSNPALYGLLMRLLYGRHYEARYRAVSALIPDGASLVEVCAGDCRLYRVYLKNRLRDYLALDYSPAFVRAAQRRNINARVFDLHTCEVPHADYVLLQASLYQFLPNAEPVVQKLRAASGRSLIIAEPIRNLSDTTIPILSWLSKKLTKPHAGDSDYSGLRFNEASLRAFCDRIGGIRQIFSIPGGRELVCVFEGSRP